MNTQVSGNFPTVIGLCGRMGVGKDAAAALLSMVGYQRVAFADQVRLEVCEAVTFGIIPTKALTFPDIARDLNDSGPGDVWAKPTSEPMRRILQWWGTEYRRDQDPDYWVKATAGRITGPTVLSDVRFPNEVDLIRNRGGVVWRITRPVEAGGIPGHVSEKLADEVKADLTIDNTGTLLDLAVQLRAALFGEL